MIFGTVCWPMKRLRVRILSDLLHGFEAWTHCFGFWECSIHLPLNNLEFIPVPHSEYPAWQDISILSLIPFHTFGHVRLQTSHCLWLSQYPTIYHFSTALSFNKVIRASSHSSVIASVFSEMCWSLLRKKTRAFFGDPTYFKCLLAQ